MTKLDNALAKVKFAGYHEDTSMGTRLYIENRISFEAYSKAFNEGRQAKKNGMKCNCMDCNPNPEKKQ